MNQDYIIPNEWSIIEEGFEKDRVKSSESLFSIGNGAMGQRANFEEFYSGDTFQGSYIAGVYYPDKTKVGWWKNGYPEYFAKVLNAPVWIGIDIEINGEKLDLNTCEVNNFRRELNMKKGILDRSFHAILPSGLEIEVFVRRFLSADLDELGVIKYDIKPTNSDAKIVYKSYVDAAVKNEDANWEEIFWEPVNTEINNQQGFVQARTFKTHFEVVTFMENKILVNGSYQHINPISSFKTESKVEFTYKVEVKTNDTATIQKFGGYVISTNHAKNELINAAKNVLLQANEQGYEQLLINQKLAWAKT
ncbi:MAG: glycoside hydrolase family 65 protein, partial [Algoriella sp.]